MGGQTSEWHTQQTVMTCLFEDVHTMVDSDRLDRAKVTTATFTEVLFAEDIICITSTPSAMNDALACIQIVGKMYGLHLNKCKCDLIRFNASSRVVFQDGIRAPLQDEAQGRPCKGT
eukprot:1840692-Karenia_brevis.AAC.1